MYDKTFMLSNDILIDNEQQELLNLHLHVRVHSGIFPGEFHWYNVYAIPDELGLWESLQHT